MMGYKREWGRGNDAKKIGKKKKIDKVETDLLAN
jgi:hypothetical protein